MEIGEIKIHEKSGRKGLENVAFFFSLCTVPLKKGKDYQRSDKER